MTEDAVNYVMADNHSDIEIFVSESESSDSSDNDDTEKVSNAQSARSKTPMGRGVRTNDELFEMIAHQTSM